MASKEEIQKNWIATRLKGETAGYAQDKPISKFGDFYRIVKELIEEGDSVYFYLNESLLFLDSSGKALELVRVRSEDRVIILSAIAQTVALAQEYGLVPKVKEDLLRARFRPSEDLISD